ncbi:YheC/YheD family protein [Paenibacillus hamazuiensis]|uniref:YheC/YheD family protein n=1 Tax=Paenibacillus hamazuiensis TaxID=2936508 RepID=UPI0020104727|nr:YheC/YheD family protein [Paenibacillus hamazuiensis]
MVSWTKWGKYKILRKSPELAIYLPETRYMKMRNLWRMLDKYGKVIVKPSGSYRGNGVVQISETVDRRYETHHENKTNMFESRETLASYLRKRKLKNYIVQERIPLARVDGRPFDLRVMVQRRKNSPWAVTGKLAKIAGKGFIVTNILRSKGKVVPVKYALQRSSLRKYSSSEILSEIDEVALMTAKLLGKYFKRIRMMGIDIGLDRKGRVWVIEANFKPNVHLFRKLKDKSVFRSIVSFK